MAGKNQPVADLLFTYIDRSYYIIVHTTDNTIPENPAA